MSVVSTHPRDVQPAPTHEAPEFAILPARGTLMIPLATARGNPNPPLDVPAVHVERGQQLPVASIDAAHRPVAAAAGTTRSAGDAMLFAQQRVPAVEFVCDPSTPAEEQIAKSIENTERFEAIAKIPDDQLATWIERFRDAGIHADRRASPDLLLQLIQTMKRPVDTVLCSLLDSDPSVALNASIARRFSAEVVAGTMLLAQIVGASQTIICADQRRPGSWLNDLRILIRKRPVRLTAIANDYPQSDPTLLLFTLLSRRLRPGRLPVEQGVILLDAAAAMAIGRFFIADEPMTHVPLAVRDHARKLSHFVMAPVGMQAGDLLAAIGEQDADVLIRGGDLLRDLILPMQAVVSGSELVLHTSDPEPDINPDACIRCGWCMEACPTRVQPAAILEAAQLDDIDLAERAGIESCIECGICSYVCPSKLPLLGGIRAMRTKHEI